MKLLFACTLVCLGGISALSMAKPSPVQYSAPVSFSCQSKWSSSPILASSKELDELELEALSQKRPSDFFVPGGTECTVPVVIGDVDQDGVLDDIDECLDTPIGIEVNAVGCTVYDRSTGNVTLNVTFDNSSAEITESSKQVLSKFVEELQQFDYNSIEIQGHSSLDGPADFNQQLSFLRANAVKDALVDDYGMNPDQLTAVGYGEERPLIEGISDRANQANRRVEVKITYAP